MSLLEFQQVSRRFGNGAGGERAVLEGVDLRLEPGECAALIGPSGAGKTTLLFLAAGLCKPTAGRVLIEGRDLGALGAGVLGALRRERIGLVFQNNLCLSALPVWENAALPLLLRGAGFGEARRKAAELLERVELGEWMESPTGALSGGQRQRLGLARAMAAGPSLLLADEPTAELDEATAGRIEERLFAWLRATGCGALIVTHSASIQRAAGRVLALEGRQLRAAETPERAREA
jgi:ABC-type lipoprotein export system ATPase subunit